MTTLAEFEILRADLTGHVDVLIQHSENYYVICREAAKREPETERESKGYNETGNEDPDGHAGTL